eukprot:g43808.t1
MVARLWEVKRRITYCEIPSLGAAPVVAVSDYLLSVDPSMVKLGELNHASINTLTPLFPKGPDWATDSIEDEFEPSTVCHRPEGLEQLQGQTKFTKKELQVLYRGFKTECPSGVVNEETFKQIYSQFFPQGDSSMYAHFLFNAFDTDHNGSVSFENFVTGLSVILRGSIEDKLSWAFNLYDLNKDGCITRE